MTRPSLSGRVSSAVGDQDPGRRECAARVGHRVVAHVVEDDVIALAARPEVLPRVVDDVIGADRAKQLQVLRAAHAGHLGAERLGDLHGERADATRRAVDQDLLSWLNPAIVAKELQGRGCGHADRRRLLERQIRRLRDELIRRCARVLREGAGAPAEHLVAGAEALHVRTDRFDDPRDIGPRNRVLWLRQPGAQAHDPRRARHQDPVADMDGRRVDAHEHLPFGDLRNVDLPRLQDLRGSIPVLGDCLHLGSPSCLCVRCKRMMYTTTYTLTMSTPRFTD